MKLELTLILLNFIQTIAYWMFYKKQKKGEIPQICFLAFMAFGCSSFVMSIRQIVNSCSIKGFGCLVSMVDVLMSFEGENALTALNAFLVIIVIENVFLTLKVVRSFQTFLKIENTLNWRSYVLGIILGTFLSLTLTLGLLVILNFKILLANF